MFIDNEAGAAISTGEGEVIKIRGSHAVAKLVRQGFSSAEACKKAVERIAKSIQVAFTALNKNGR